MKYLKKFNTQTEYNTYMTGDHEIPNVSIYNNEVHYTPQQFVTFTMNAYEMSTYCSEYDLDFTNVEGLTAWIVTAYNGSSTVTKNVVNNSAAGTGLIITGSAGTYKIPIQGHGIDYSSRNMLIGTLQNTQVGNTEGYSDFLLSVKNGNIGFYVSSAGTLGPNKAFLRILTSEIQS